MAAKLSSQHRFSVASLMSIGQGPDASNLHVDLHRVHSRSIAIWSGIQHGFQPARPEDDGHYKGFFISWVGAAHRYQMLDGRALPDRLITTNNPALWSTHGSVDLSHCFLRCMIRWMRRM
ncbi:hypothetical protein CIHG_04301 [Coccidioides immitis H538.4]|uniref:Uncharacterized protein n=1 Tax=Coccidioides immitis H538.4 TaxID=396776 RepID=A0A0J8RNW3_COCIT|nr:hypothetical protein CIHG_04301 [Coccidioides immitis H538.4]